MRNLFLFIERYRTFLLFLLLEGFCFFLVINFHSYQRSSFLNSANFVTGNVYKTYDNAISYLYLGRVNDSLRVENARLYSQLPNAHGRIPEPEKEICEFDPPQIYKYISAKVINNSTDKVNNYITLDIGRKDGIEKNMGVIGPKGVVGIVTNVSENFASVMSVLHKDCRISAKIKRSNYSGSVSWNAYSNRQAELIGIPNHVDIVKGDTVLSSGFSSVFPEDVPIGIVDDYSIPNGSNFYDIKINLFTEFSRLHYVYVVNYLFKSEKKKLEALND
ncbi:MAG: rod shape-determining protein MreC [Chitinophagales bacterium]